MSEQPEQPEVSVDKLVKIYIKMRNENSRLLAEFEEKQSKLETQMGAVKKALVKYCIDNSVESMRTESGSFYRTIKKRYTTNDWDAMNRFILEHSVPELLEKRIHQGNMSQFLEEHPDLLPQGLNCDAEYSVTVRSVKK
jgi:hypothetical protein